MMKFCSNKKQAPSWNDAIKHVNNTEVKKGSLPISSWLGSLNRLSDKLPLTMFFHFRVEKRQSQLGKQKIQHKSRWDPSGRYLNRGDLLVDG